ncbi:MAG: serine--tRNA ligase, partial [Erysipelotrichaceae bacterium]|nr:serine--tRNA ligase [Erysipelotrichaceae bacterium]
MIDIKLIRENPELVKENIRKKFQDEKLVLVDEVKALDEEYRALRTKADELRSQRNAISKQIGALMGQGKKEEAEQVKEEVKKIGEQIEECELEEPKLEEKIRERMLVIPNIIDVSVPIGKDDSENVEIEQFGAKRTFDYEIPYHTDIMESLNGIDLDSARKTSGNGFYYLTGDIARLHSAILAYA